MERVWIKTADQLPTKDLLMGEFGKGCVDCSHADCYIFIRGQVEIRPFNFHHLCWDDDQYDDQYDDHEYDADEPTHWMLAHPYPAPPTE